MLKSPEGYHSLATFWGTVYLTLDGEMRYWYCEVLGCRQANHSVPMLFADCPQFGRATSRYLAPMLSASSTTPFHPFNVVAEPARGYLEQRQNDQAVVVTLES